MLDTVFAEFLAKKEVGALKVDRFQQATAQALAPVELTVARQADGVVHFGDVVQLAHATDGAVLSTNVNDVDRRAGAHACSATASPDCTLPCARNTFLLAKYISDRLDVGTTHYPGDALRYGQKIRLIANPMAQGQALDASGGRRPLCLFSKPISTQHCAKYSHNQVAGFTTDADYDTVFKVVALDPAKRIASEGVEVLAGVPLCLEHCATSALLCLSGAPYPTQLGIEQEMSFQTTRPHAKKAVLVHEQQGELSKTIPPKHEATNHFVLVIGTRIAQLPDTRPRGVDDVLVKVHAQLQSSSMGYDGFRKHVLRLDATGSGAVPADELQLGLRYAGVDVSPEEMGRLQAQFTTTQKGVVNVRALLAQVEKLATL